MQKTILTLSLTLRGPLLTQSPNPGQLGLDAVIARNHRNQAYIPGSLVSGKIRQALEELRDAAVNGNKPALFEPDLDDWLGKASKNDFAKSKRLFFSDFVLHEDEPATATRYRIEIDSERESVSQHQLAMLESPFVSGEPYTFTGQVHFFSSSAKAETIIQHLRAAIKWLYQLGAFRSIGFGQVEKTQILELETFPIPVSHPSGNAEIPERIGFWLQAEYPFCLAGKPCADNLFQSEAIIPGGAIKGCIATTWNHANDQHSGRIDAKDSERWELRENFSKLRLSHAFPGHTLNRRPVVAPLSLVKIPIDSHLYDVALLPGPSLIAGKPPDFAVDWKDSPDTLKEYPWPYVRFKEWGWDSLDSELRIRTAIDRQYLRSKENELFAYESIIPDNEKRGGEEDLTNTKGMPDTRKKTWYGELNLTQIDAQNRRNVFEQLQTLCSQGLIGLGKTKTPFQIGFIDSIEPALSNSLNPIGNGLWLITLQTDALLGSPEKLNETSGEKELHEMYQNAWYELSDGKLKLLRYFARQRLSGGRHRQKTLQNSGPRYRPWLLTEAGSIFVLQSGDNADLTALQSMISNWLAQGLPLTESVACWYGLGSERPRYWQHTPFVPENGYGEIAVNIEYRKKVTQLEENDRRVNSISTIDVTNKEKTK